MKTVLLAAFAVIALSGAAHAQRLSNITGQKLVDYCMSRDKAKTEVCTAYVDGIADTVGFYQRLRPADQSKGAPLPNYICVPTTVTGDQLRDAVIAWFKKHPERATQQASGIVMNALNDTYLCAGERPRTEPPK